VIAAPGELQPFALQQLEFWASDTRLVAQLASLPAVSIEAKINHQDDLRTMTTQSTSDAGCDMLHILCSAMQHVGQLHKMSS